MSKSSVDHAIWTLDVRHQILYINAINLINLSSHLKRLNFKAMQTYGGIS
jgi:hypothetical protein